jgi:ElaB/YqjD/DUF883 family membrane-anchored ribosome-binding protein
MNEEHGHSHAKSATDELKDTVADIGQNVRQMSEELGGVAKEKYKNLRDQATGYYEQGREKASEFESQIEGYVTDKPIHALLIAAGIGLLVGLMWRRRG